MRLAGVEIACKNAEDYTMAYGPANVSYAEWVGVKAGQRPLSTGASELK
jgi:hypothetical protein